MADCARTEAVAAIPVVADGAVGKTAGTMTFAAAATGGFTFLTDPFTARAAGESVFVVGHETAVTARPAVPIGQRHERALVVVGAEHARHELEEIRQPALGQRLADGPPTVSFAQDLVQDVRMRHFRAGGGRVGLQRHDPVTGVGGQAARVEADFKRPQLKTFEFNRFGADCESVFAAVVTDRGELVGQSQQVLVDITGSGRGGACVHDIDLMFQLDQGASQRAQGITQVQPQIVRRQPPALEFRAADLSHQRLAALPAAGRQVG